jgi:hypothetical protein
MSTTVTTTPEGTKIEFHYSLYVTLDEKVLILLGLEAKMAKCATQADKCFDFELFEDANYWRAEELRYESLLTALGNVGSTYSEVVTA